MLNPLRLPSVVAKASPWLKRGQHIITQCEGAFAIRV